MERKLNRTLLNGKKYEFVECEIFGHSTVYSYCEWDGKMNHIDLSFRNLTEAEEWCNEQDENFLNPHTETVVTTMTEKDYYSCTGYYGD